MNCRCNRLLLEQLRDVAPLGSFVSKVLPSLSAHSVQGRALECGQLGSQFQLCALLTLGSGQWMTISELWFFHCKGGIMMGWH